LVVFLNTGPRPEGYVEDYETVNLAQPALNETEAEDLYVQLASGAESGWDYTARWMKAPLANISDPLQGLRSLNIRSIIPVDLNAILTSNHYRLADLYDQYSLSSSTSGNSSSLSNATARADLHRMQGDKGKEALLDLMWDSEKYSFYDFNMTSNARSDFWALSAFFPYWLDIFPPELETDPEAAQKAFAGLDYILAKYDGAVPASLTASTLNWDFPNAWPPLQYILAEGLDKLNANVTNQTYASLVSSVAGNGSLWDLIPTGQLGMNETDLPEQPGQAANATSAGIQAHDAYADESTTWRDAIQHAIVQRYTEAAFCSWCVGPLSSSGDFSPADALALPQVFNRRLA
jgi:alpha,alpha-trehalase